MPDLSNKAVLYLDDEDINLFLFEANFKKKFKVYTARTSHEAFTKLEAHQDQIVAVISDMRMPVIDGIEFVIKAKEKYPQFYYYIMTGFEHNQEIEEALDKNLIKKRFKKPFNVQEIEEEVLKVAESS